MQSFPAATCCRVPSIIAAAALSGLSTAAHAQWTVSNLNPAGSIQAYAFAAGGGQQAGYASVGGLARASLWNGTAASWVDLSPTGSTESRAFAVGDGQQAGYAIVGGVSRAGLWSGTAASWVDLNPVGAQYSVANAVSGGQQAGWVVVGGMGRASLWSGTAASWVDLAPVGASSSAVNAVGGGQQVGVAYFGGRARAGLWSGTASSWVDLSSFLPVGFTDTYATGISSDGVNIFISGYGTNATGVQALLWTQPIPGPGAVALLGLGGLLTTRRRR